MANIVFQHNQPLKVATVNNGKKNPTKLWRSRKLKAIHGW